MFSRSNVTASTLFDHICTEDEQVRIRFTKGAVNGTCRYAARSESPTGTWAAFVEDRAETVRERKREKHTHTHTHTQREESGNT